MLALEIPRLFSVCAMEGGNLTPKSFGVSASQSKMLCRDTNTGFYPSITDEGYTQDITCFSAYEILKLLLGIFCFSPSITAFACSSSFPSMYLLLITHDC